MDIQIKLSNKTLYKTSIDGLRLKLVELQNLNKKAYKIRTESLNSYEKVDEILHCQRQLFVPQLI